MLRRGMLFAAFTLALLLTGTLYVAAGPPAQDAPTPTPAGILPAPGVPPVTVPVPTPSLTPFGGAGTPVPMGAESSDSGILATPTLSDDAIHPPRRLVGDISNIAEVLGYFGYLKKDSAL